MEHMQIFKDFINKINEKILSLKQDIINKDNLEYQKSMIEGLISLLENPDSLYDQRLSLDLHLQSIYPYEEYLKISEKISKAVIGYNIVSKKDKELYEREIHNFEQIISRFLMLVKVKRLNVENDLSSFKEDSNNKLSFYQNILKCLNLGLPLSKKRIRGIT